MYKNNQYKIKKMANPATASMGANPPKIIENTKYKVRKDVLETFHDCIPTSSVTPTYQDRIIHFKVIN